MNKLKRIHVNRNHIAQNLKDGGQRPTITCKVGKENHKGMKIEILGPCEIFDAVYNGEKPLSCGARVFIKTRSPVVVDGVQIE